MLIQGAPDGLTALVLVFWDGDQYSMSLTEVKDALPLERRLLARGLRQLADAVDDRAESLGES